MVAVMALAASVRAQVMDSTVSPEPAQTPVALPTAARIIGEIPDGTALPPPPPKPEIVVPANDILSTTTHQQGGRTITIQRINPIALPPPTAPDTAAALTPAQIAACRQRIAEHRAAHPREQFLTVGATVYRTAGQAPRTFVQYWPAGANEPVAFWSSADFSLLSGIQSFADTQGHIFNMFMMWSEVDIGSAALRSSAQGRAYSPPQIPIFPGDALTNHPAAPAPPPAATYILSGAPPEDPALVAPIQTLHDIYNNEHSRLLLAWQGRERARLKQEADLIANPPQAQETSFSTIGARTPRHRRREVPNEAVDRTVRAAVGAGSVASLSHPRYQ